VLLRLMEKMKHGQRRRSSSRVVLRNHKHQYKHDHREFSGEFHFVLADSFDSKCFEFATVVSSKSTNANEADCSDCLA